MKHSLTLLASAAMLALAAPAFAEDKASTTIETKVTSDSDGNYKKNTDYEHTDMDGTKTKSHIESKVKTDITGNVDRSVEAETTTDPKGLMNKTTTKSETSVAHKANGTVEYHHKKKVNGKVIEDQKTVNADTRQ